MDIFLCVLNIKINASCAPMDFFFQSGFRPRLLKGNFSEACQMFYSICKCFSRTRIAILLIA